MQQFRKVGALALLALMMGCGGKDDGVVEPASDTTVWPDLVVPDTGPQIEDTGPIDVGDTGFKPVPDTKIPDVPVVPDAGPEIEIVEIPKGPTGSALAWAPAFADDLIITVDSQRVISRIPGLPTTTVAEIEDNETALSPVAITEGLLCWDIDQDGEFDVFNEDYDGDGEPGEGDCALHPEGFPNGATGVLLTINTEAGCQLRAITAAGHPAWTQSLDGQCFPAASVGAGFIVPTSGGQNGNLQFFRARNGSTGAKITLPGSPTTGPARLDQDHFAIGSDLGVTVVGVGFGDSPALFTIGTVNTAPDVPLALAASGEGTLIAAMFRAGDAPGSFGRRIQRFVIEPEVEALGDPISLPGDQWTQPLSVQIAGAWQIIAAGYGWVRGFDRSTGEEDWTLEVPLGTVTGLAAGADERIYVAETEWNGDETVDARWQVRRVAPGLTNLAEVVMESVGQVPIRGVSSPILRCQTVHVQTVSIDQLSTTVQSKACPGALAPAGWSRPFGGNDNRGNPAVAVDCWAGQGVPPCEAVEGCTDNADCDDQSECTLDSCQQGECTYKLLPGCCLDDDDCDDGDPCTVEECLATGECKYLASTVCCESSVDCDDGSVCTVDVCDQGFCSSFPDPTVPPGCCAQDSDCLDGPLTCDVGVCSSQGECFTGAAEDCCETAADCFDDTVCTLETCVDNLCQYQLLPESEGCCENDADCEDDNPCTATTCFEDTATCGVVETQGCCFTDSDCDDGVLCSVDTCIENVCLNVLDGTLDGCCSATDECPPSEDLCLLPICDPETAQCDFEDLDCDDGVDCTDDECEDGVCFNPENLDLCDDGLPCTLDYCDEELACHNDLDPTLPGCCEDAAGCDDGDPCTEDVCETFLGCANPPIEGCCIVDSECDDGNVNTADDCTEANICELTLCQQHVLEPETKPVDIVFIVDQSDSMSGEIPMVQQYLSDYAAFVTGETVDYHVILVATRYDDANAICVPEPLGGPACTNSSTFKQIEQQVSSHNGLQLVMDEIDAIEAFMRVDSTRHFVMISDDESQVDAQTFDFFLNSRPGYDNYAFHSIVSVNSGDCAISTGDTYAELSQMTGGFVLDVCDANWGGSYEQLGTASAVASASFFLEEPAVAETVGVTYDGVPMAVGSWTYDPATNRVTLSKPFPIPWGTVEICFVIAPDESFEGQPEQP
ncbi:MAG: hypothetical protein ACI9WU_000249 [Myxococcota bacterium]|jgi:hypothetical protein